MSYLALYRKYRPTSFDRVVGQDFVVKILKNSIVSGKISHAYLFSGPRGTGKTTTAKLIAKLINCSNPHDGLPCCECESCISIQNKNNPDIIEMDAASNNGVDEIREIRDKISLMPTISKYKIYIIDEVHMLSIGAFNALLKTLEEPPKHAIFILATTEFYKVPETIISRCQCFNFERISNSNIVKALEYIVSNENIVVEKEVLELIAKYSDGGLRDAINMLDKLYCSSSNITVNDFYNLKGLVDRDEFKLIVDSIFSGDVKNVMEHIDNINNLGKNVVLFAYDLLDYVKNLLLNETINYGINYDVSKLYQFIDILTNTITGMKSSSYPKILFDVGILKIVNMYVSSNEIISREIIYEKKCDDNTKLGTLATSSSPTKEIDSSKNKITLENRDIRVNNALALASKSLLDEMKILWIKFSDYLNDTKYSSVVSFLIDGNLRVAGDGYVIISVKYDSILDNAFKFLDLIEYLFSLVMGKMYKIAFIVDSDWDKIKHKYIEDKNAGVKYKIIEEKVLKDDIIEDEVVSNNVSGVTSDAINLFGDDLVEIK